MNYFVYIVRSAKGNFYTGISTHPERRCHEHNFSTRGAKCLRGQRPVNLVWVSQDLFRSDAFKLEYKIKQMTHAEKEIFIKENLNDQNISNYV
jgi:putative endonuclease